MRSPSRIRRSRSLGSASGASNTSATPPSLSEPPSSSTSDRAAQSVKLRPFHRSPPHPSSRTGYRLSAHCSRSAAVRGRCSGSAATGTRASVSAPALAAAEAAGAGSAATTATGGAGAGVGAFTTHAGDDPDPMCSVTGVATEAPATAAGGATDTAVSSGVEASTGRAEAWLATAVTEPGTADTATGGDAAAGCEGGGEGVAGSDVCGVSHDDEAGDCSWASWAWRRASCCCCSASRTANLHHGIQHTSTVRHSPPSEPAHETISHVRVVYA